MTLKEYAEMHRIEEDSDNENYSHIMRDGKEMENEIITETELMTIDQLPVLSEKFIAISEEVKAESELAKAMDCTEENLASIRKTRTGLSKKLEAFEKRRIEVKKLIMKPYDDLNSTYKQYVSDVYNSALKDLDAKILEVSNEIKNRMIVKIKAYFDELCKSVNIDFLTFEQAKINVTLSASEKLLKSDAKEFVERVVGDLALIETQENKAEILVEFKKSLNVSQAIQTVVNRHKAIDEEKARREAQEAIKETSKVSGDVKVEEKPYIDFFSTPAPTHKTFKIKVPNALVDEIEYFLSLNEIEMEELK